MTRFNDDSELNSLFSKGLADSLPNATLPRSSRRAMKERLLTKVAASEPEGTTTLRAEAAKWTLFAQGIYRKVLREDQESGTETALYRMEPGAIFDAHVHTHQEECLVLEGKIDVGGMTVFAGDMHIAKIGTTHPAIEAIEACILLIRSQVYDSLVSGSV